MYLSYEIPFFRRPAVALLLLAAVAAIPLPAFAGGQLETVDITAREPSPIPGQVVGEVVGTRQDPRCIPVHLSLNDTLDPIPNPLGPDFLTVADARAALAAAARTWTDIPTSYIDLRVDGTTSNPGFRHFDMINELTFRTPPGFDLIAATRSMTLMEDTLLEDGDDLDGDGDPDVSAAITTCSDADGDGDIELPAGLYPAGTILDSDIMFNTKDDGGFRFTTSAADADTEIYSVDLQATATHEMGHVQGLSHTLNNQVSSEDGTGATLFPFIDTGDPASELSIRVLDTDDIAWSSYVYPEGSASSGPAALQPGDVAFSQVFGLIRGEARHGTLGLPLAGGSVFAVDAETGELKVSAFTGSTQLSVDPQTGGLFVVADPSFHLTDGRYTLPVPYGRYELGIEAVDGDPVPAGVVNFTVQLGAFFGEQNFEEELYGRGRERGAEQGPERAILVPVTRSGSSSLRIDFVTDRTPRLADFGSRNIFGFRASPPGLYYAVRFPASEIVSATGGRPFEVRAGRFLTFVADHSVVPVYSEAALTTGHVEADGTARLDLAHPLAKVAPFIGEDQDFAPLFFRHPRQLGERLREGIIRGEIDSVFLVLRLPTSAPFPGVSALPPGIGLDGGIPDNDEPIHGLSFISADGEVFTPDPDFNYMFSLSLGEVH